jgi:hypothetical protein
MRVPQGGTGEGSYMAKIDKNPSGTEKGGSRSFATGEGFFTKIPPQTPLFLGVTA